jgi:hypothetical protein
MAAADDGAGREAPRSADALPLIFAARARVLDPGPRTRRPADPAWQDAEPRLLASGHLAH